MKIPGILLVCVLLLVPRHAAWGEGAITVGVSPGVAQTPGKPGVCRVSNTIAGDGTYYGSGTVVDVDAADGAALVLTCWHIFRPGTGQVGVCVGGRCAVGRLVRVDEAWDLAAVQISATGLPPMPVAADSPARGEALTACGFGRGTFRCVAGRVLGYVATETAGSRETLEIAAAVRDGDSGGPVLNGRGELVGVVWGSDRGITEATCVGPIRRFLGRLRRRDGRQLIGPPAARPDTPGESDCCPTPPAGQQAAPGPLVPIPPAGEQAAPRIDAEKLRAAIEAAFGKLEARIEARRNAAPIDAGDDQRPILDAIRGLGSKIGAGIDREAIREDFRAVAGDLVDAAAPTVLETALPAALTALGWTGPPAIAAWLVARLGLGLLRRRRQRRKAAAEPGPSGMMPGRVVIEQSPPPPQQVVRTREFVNVEKPNGQLRALQAAMDEYVRRYPAGRATIETIESYAGQFRSGQTT